MTITWWHSHAEIARLLRWLDDGGELEDVEACWRLVEKPWHWDKEYDQMCADQDGPTNARESEAEAAETRSEAKGGEES